MPTLTLDGDAAGAVKAAGAVANSAEEIKKKFREAAREAEALERAAKKIVEENATPQERYNSQIQKLTELFAAGKLTADQVNRATESYRHQLDETIKLQEKSSAAYKTRQEAAATAARASKELEEQAKRLVEENATPLEQYNAKMEKLAKAYVAGYLNVQQMDREVARLGKTLDESTRKHEQQHEAHEEAFGAESLHELMNYAAGLVTVEKGLEFVAEAAKAASEERKKAAEDVASGLGDTSLVNAANNPEEYKRGLDIGRDFISAGIFNRSQQSSALQFGAAAVDTGASDSDVELLKKLAENRYVGASQLAGFALDVRRIREAYPGAGSFQDIAKELRQAGADTGLLDFGAADIGKYAADVSKVASDNGQSSEQVLARFVANARVLRSAKSAEAATKDQLEKGDDFSGSGQAIYDQELAKLRSAPTGPIPDYLGGDPRLRAARGLEREQGSYASDVENENAEAETLYQRMHVANRRGKNWFARHVDRTIEMFGGWFGQEANAVDQMATEPNFAKNAPADLLKDMRDFHERAVKEAEKQTSMMQRNDRSLPPPTGLQE